MVEHLRLNLDGADRETLLDLRDFLRTHRSIEVIEQPAVAVAPLVEDLSPSEIELLRIARQGKSNREIAEAVNLSKGTVGNRLHEVYQKLGVHRRFEAVRRAEELGLLEADTE